MAFYDALMLSINHSMDGITHVRITDTSLLEEYEDIYPHFFIACQL